MSDIIEKARVLRAKIEENAAVMDDDAAAEYAELFPSWKAGRVYEVGDRVRHTGTLYKVLQPHTSQEDWTPDNAPSLFAAILPGQDGTEIGVWQQPDSTNPYRKGDRVYYPDKETGKLYESTVDNNVWSPADYPQGWKEAEV